MHQAVDPAGHAGEAAGIVMNITESILAHIERLEQENARLLLCCDFTADGKPVPRGSTLYFCPNNDPERDLMTLKTGSAIHYCWYLTPEDAVAASKS